MSRAAPMPLPHTSPIAMPQLSACKRRKNVIVATDALSWPTYREDPAVGDPARLAFDEEGGLIVSLAKSRMSRPPEKKRVRELNPGARFVAVDRRSRSACKS
jgi:hypothetical protein